jgi:hypothetical protein
MLEWLLPEYDVYCVYQKYPGILYEYPAIRFAKYIINNKKRIMRYIFILKEPFTLVNFKMI